MSSDLAAGKALGLLGDLKAAIEELAGRAAKLTEDHNSRVAKERLRCEAAVEEQKKQLTASMTEAEATFRSARAATQTRFERRKARIGKAYQASKEQGLQKVETGIGALKYELQKKMLQAERDRETGLSTAQSNFEEFRRQLASEQEKLAVLEQNAQRAFGGYRTFQRLFLKTYETSQADTSRDEQRMFADMVSLMGQAESQLARFRRNLLVGLFKYLPAWLLVGLAGCAFAAAAFLPQAGINGISWRNADFAAGGLAVLLVIRFVARGQAQPLARALSTALAQARHLHDAAHQRSETHYQEEMERIKDGFLATTQTADQKLKQGLAHAGERRVSCRMSSDERAVRVNSRNEGFHRAASERLTRGYGDALERLKSGALVRIKSLADASDEKVRTLTGEYETAWKALELEWKKRTESLYAALDALRTQAAKLFPPWDSAAWKEWSPPRELTQAAKFA